MFLFTDRMIMIEILNIVKILIYSKLSYRFSSIPYKIPIFLFIEVNKLLEYRYGKTKELDKEKNLKEQSWRTQTFLISRHNEARVIKTI